jgi:hypothetical protein
MYGVLRPGMEAEDSLVNRTMSGPGQVARNLGGSVLAGLLGAPGDLNAMFPKPLQGALPLPTSEQLQDKFGVEANRPESYAGLLGAPDATDIGRALPLLGIGLRKLWKLKPRSGALSLFHQTKKANAPGLLSEGFDLQKAGARQSESILPDGVYLKSSDADIGLGGAQLQANADVNNVIEFNNRDEIAAFISSKDDRYAELVEQTKSFDRAKAEEFDALEERLFSGTSSDEEYMEGLNRLDRFFDDWQKELNELSAQSRERATKVLEREGFDAVMIKHDAGSFGRSTDTTIILDPSKVNFKN